MAAIAVLGLLAGVGGGVLIATSGHLVHPLAYGLQIAIMVVGTVGVGLYWAVARPGNRISLVLLAYAVAVAGVAAGAASPLLHSIGVLFDAPMFLLGWYLVFVFPSGRLVGALEKCFSRSAWIRSFVPAMVFLLAGRFRRCPLAAATRAAPRTP
jgi:hypothetical protein